MVSKLGGSKPVKLKLALSSLQNALPLFSKGDSNNAGPA
jgi:hypothetical protein